MIIKTYGNLVYEIYRENGKKIIRKISDFQPYFFVKENEESLKDHRILKEEYGEYYSIFGDKLKKIIARRPFYIRQLREYYTDTFEGDVLYRNRYLIDRVDHSKHNYEYRICYIDIECDAREGFPHPEEAKYPITVMTCYDTILKKYFVFTWRQDQKDRIEKTEERTTYFFNKEKDMLEMFIRYLRHTWPEIITGWNVINFDFHYIINRMKKLHVNPMKMSRFNWVKLNKFEDNISISIDGIDLIDLMKVYIKFQYIKAFNPSKKLESYSLKAVSEYEELGQKYQLDDDMSLADMWVKDLNKTIEYNQRDVELLLAIEDKLKLFNFMNEIKKMGFCSMEDVMTSSRLIDNYILKYAKDNNIILPTANRFVDNEKYEGAEIYTKGVGLVKNVAGFDFKSMYPSIMITFNTSPEVKNIEGNNIEVNNVKFSLDKEGFASKIVKNLIAERYKWKKERNKLKFNSIEYLAAYDKETSIKTIVNSFYGVFGYPNFRLYDRDIASTITYVGRNLFKVTKKLCEKMGYEVCYGHSVIGDTCVPIKINNKIELHKLEDMWNFDGNIEYKDNNEYKIFKDKILTLTHNYNTKESEWKEIKYIMRHKTKKDLHVISHPYCTPILTSDHSIMCEGKETSPLKFKDRCVYEEAPKIDFIEYKNELEQSKTRIDLSSIVKEYSKIRNKHKIKILKEKIHIKERGKIRSIPRYIKLDSDFGAILGAYIAEGSVAKKDNYYVNLRICTGLEKQWIYDIYRKCKKIFGREDVVFVKDKKSYNGKDYGYRTYINGSIYAYIFYKLCGYSSRNKHLPDFYLETKKKFLNSLIFNYQIVDGYKYCIFKDLKEGVIRGKSRKLASQIFFLIKCYDFVGKNVYTKIKYGESKNYPIHQLTWINLNKATGLCKAAIKRKNNKIVRRKEYKKYYDGYVYDISVKDNHVFTDALGNCILHNTDSVMVKLPDEFSIETCIEKSKELMDKINAEVKKYTEKFGITDNHIEIDFEKFFKSAVFTEAEARYFALLVHDGNKFIEPVVRITGFEGIKRDTPLYMRKFLVNFYRKVLDLKTKEELRDYIKDTIKNCKKQDLMDIGFTIRIAKKLEEYEGNAYHVRAAKYSNKYLGTHFKRTDYIKIMYVKNKDKQVPETDIVAFDLGSQKTMLNHFKIDWAKQLDRIMFMKIDQVCKIINLNVEDIRQKIRGQSNLGDYT